MFYIKLNIFRFDIHKKELAISQFKHKITVFN